MDVSHIKDYAETVSESVAQGRQVWPGEGMAGPCRVEGVPTPVRCVLQPAHWHGCAGVVQAAVCGRPAWPVCPLVVILFLGS